MIQDLGTVVWKELHEFFAGGAGRGRLVLVIVPLIFGVVIPALNNTTDWGTSFVPLLLYGLYLPVMLILSVAADSFAGERERHTLETLLASRLPDQAILFGKLSAVTLFGWGQGFVTALVGLVVVNLAHPGHGLIIYAAPVWAGIIGLGLVMSLLGASASALVSLRAATVRQAQQILSIALLVIIFGSGFALGALPVSVRLQLVSLLSPEHTQTLLVGAGLIVLVVDIVLIVVARALFQRSRLILSGQ